MKVLVNKCYGGFDYSDEFCDYIKSLGIEDDSLFDRDNQFLVEEAIKFGLDNASGICSDLKICEIPDGASYSVQEYDGSEWIEIYIQVTIDELRNGLSEENLNLVLKGCDIRLKS